MARRGGAGVAAVLQGTAAVPVAYAPRPSSGYERPQEFEVEVKGDLSGQGVWTLTEWTGAAPT